MFKAIRDLLWWRRVLRTSPGLAEKVQLQNDLTCGLCRECRTFASCRNIGFCEVRDQAIPPEPLSRMRAAEKTITAQQR